MASALVSSGAVLLLLFVQCLFVVAHIVCRIKVFGHCFALKVLCVVSSCAIISLGKKELVALRSLCSEWHVAVIVILLFLAVPWCWSVVCDCGIS